MKSTLNGASDKLEAALTRLEQVVRAKAVVTGSSTDVVPRSEYESIQRDIESLHQECAQLRTELQTADETQAKLREAGKSMVNDLDRAIVQIDCMVES